MPLKPRPAVLPAQYVAGRVAGDHAKGENQTQSGIEPHDLELTRLEPAKPGSGETGTDPHFSQDPTRFSAAAVAFEKDLARVDPKHATEYARNLAGSARTRPGLIDRSRKGWRTARSERQS